MDIRIITQAAKTAHEVHLAYCKGIGHKTQPEWDELSEEHRNTVLHSVEKILTGEFQSPEEAHDNFVKMKISSGWKFSLQYSAEEKTNPRLCTYEMLPTFERTKESLFFECVSSFM